MSDVGTGHGRKTAAAFCLIACFFAAAAVVILGYDALERRKNPRPYFEYVSECSVEYGVSIELIYGIMSAESGFDELAVSSAGACGLMQLMPSTFVWLCDDLGLDASGSDIFDPHLNIRCGVRYIAHLQERFGETETVIAAYNAGEGTVARWLCDPTLSRDGKRLSSIPYSETDEYCRRVMNLRDRYERLYFKNN